MTATAHAIAPMSDSRKIQIIHSIPKADRKWRHDLTKDERRFVLAGMEIGIDERWILGLIEDARAMREDSK
jgi:hypothetical protein